MEIRHLARKLSLAVLLTATPANSLENSQENIELKREYHKEIHQVSVEDIPFPMNRALYVGAILMPLTLFYGYIVGNKERLEKKEKEIKNTIYHYMRASKN